MPGFDRINIIIIFLIASGGIVSIIFSLTLLAVKKKKVFNYLNCAIFFIYGVCVLCDTQYRIGSETIVPHLLYVNYPLLYLLGPILIIYFRSLLTDKIIFSIKQALFLIPSLLTLIFYAPFYFQPASKKLSMYPLSSSGAPFVRIADTIIEYLILAWIAVCFILALLKILHLWNKKNKVVRIVLIYLSAWILLALSFTYSDIFQKITLYKINLVLANLLIIILIGISLRYPYFFNVIRKETRNLRYATSKLKYLDIDAALDRIEELMENDEIYADENLSLQTFSEMARISPQQLSEIINNKYKQNFNAFVNGYRVKAVKKMIEIRPHSNILSLALKCGFNSKSTFNSAFMKFVGKTPSVFRSEIKKNKSENIISDD